MTRHAAPPSTVRVAPFTRPQKKQGGLRKAAVSGTKWSLVQYGGSKIMTVVVFAVLSHLLAPSEFGVVALANVFIAFLTLFVNGGFGQAIIQREDLTDGHVDTVFWLNVATSVVLAGTLAAVAGPISGILGEPGLAPVLRVLSVGMVLTALSISHNVLLRRALRFKTVAVRTLVATVAGSVAGLTFAFLGAGVWALVAQYLVFSLVQTVLLWTLSGWRPGGDVSVRYLRDVLGYSSASLLNSLLIFFSARSDDFLIGAWLGSRALGFYSVGYRLLSVVSDLIGSVLTSVAFPVFARLQSDLAALGRAYTAVVRAGAAMAFPGYFIFVVIAGDTTRVLFGSQWGPAVPVMQLLALFGAIQTTLSTCDNVLVATGQPHIVWKYRLANVLVQVGAFAVAAPYGINWVAFTLVARAYLMLPIPVWFVRRQGIAGYGVFFRALLTPLIGSAVMVGLLQLCYVTLLAGLSPFVRLPIALVLGGAVYAVTMVVIDRRLVREVLDTVRPTRRRPAGRTMTVTPSEPDPMEPDPIGDGPVHLTPLRTTSADATDVDLGKRDLP